MESLLNVLTTKVNIISAISLKRQFEISFIDKDRWQLYLEGLGNTLIVTFFALILGIVIGAVVAIVRASYDKNYSEMKGGLGKILLAIFNIISKIYLTVVRGTPVVIQIMITLYLLHQTIRFLWQFFHLVLTQVLTLQKSFVVELCQLTRDSLKQEEVLDLTMFKQWFM